MITTLKELKFLTSNLTDFSKINLLNINSALITYLPQEQKNQLFMAKAKLVHGNKYDYSKVIRINDVTKVEIICPMHGLFWQQPTAHLQGQGCPECGKIGSNLRNIKNKITIEQFIARARLIHSDLYNYDKIKWVDKHTKIELICLRCNSLFWQVPISHLLNRGCEKCNYKESKPLMTKNNTAKINAENSVNIGLEKFKATSFNIHKGVISATKNGLKTFKGVRSKIEFYCRTCNTSFIQLCRSHVAGTQCPNCSMTKRYIYHKIQ